MHGVRWFKSNRWRIFLGAAILAAAIAILGPFVWKYCRAVSHIPSNFEFNLGEANIHDSIAKYPGKVLLSPNTTDDLWYAIDFILGNGNKISYENVDATSVFHASDGVLYIALIRRGGSGGVVDAYDLTTGDLMWRSVLRILPIREHSAYDHRANIDVIPAFVRIFSRESHGEYCAILDRATGRVVASKIYRDIFR